MTELGEGRPSQERGILSYDEANPDAPIGSIDAIKKAVKDLNTRAEQNGEHFNMLPLDVHQGFYSQGPDEKKMLESLPLLVRQGLHPTIKTYQLLYLKFGSHTDVVMGGEAYDYLGALQVDRLKGGQCRLIIRDFEPNTFKNWRMFVDKYNKEFPQIASQQAA